LSGAAQEAAAALYRFGPEMPASAHRLEEHATCGFRSLAHGLLHVKDDRRDDIEIDARERGNLLHRCLERFFRRLRDEKRLPLRAGPEEIGILREIAGREIAAFAGEEHVGNRALWELKRAELIDDLIAVVESEEDANPLELERRFGFEEPDS